MKKMMKKREIAIIVLFLIGGTLSVFCLAGTLQRTQLLPSTLSLHPSDEITDPHTKEQFTKVKQWADRLQQMLDETFRKISLAQFWISVSGDDIYKVNGNVGIGTTSPGYKLTLDGSFMMDTTTGTQPFYVSRLGATNQALKITVDDARVNFYSEQDEDDSAVRGGFGFYMDDDGSQKPNFLVNLKSGTELFRVQQNGNVRVGGAISSATSTFSTVGPTDNVDVSGINTLFIDNSSNAITIGGFASGVDGQILHVVLINAGANNVIIEHNETGATQKIYLHRGSDETLNTEYGGWVFVCHGGIDWHDCSHSRH